MNFLVVGETCNDKFIYGKVERICPEAPVPVFRPTRETNHLGMAANVRANLQAIISEHADPSSTCNLISNVTKGSKTRYVDEVSNQMLMRVDDETYLSVEDVRKVDFDKYDAVIVSDYNKGFLSYNDLKFIATKCIKANMLSFLDTKKEYSNYHMNDYTFIKINDKEYHNNKFKLANKDNLIVTKGANGCEYNGEHFPCQASQVFDVSGAGDTFLAAFAYQYTLSHSINSSINYAQTCCAKVVAKKGVCTI